MSRDEMIEHLESGEWPRIGMVIAALRDRPAPPDDLVALHAQWRDAYVWSRTALAGSNDEEREHAARIALLAWDAPAHVAAPALVRPEHQSDGFGTCFPWCPRCVADASAVAAPAPETPARACHGCGYTLVRCYDCKRGGAVACCPDCDHSERSTEPAPGSTPAPVDVPACPDGQHSYRRNAPPQNGDVCFVCRKSIWWETPAPDAMPEKGWAEKNARRDRRLGWLVRGLPVSRHL